MSVANQYSFSVRKSPPNSKGEEFPEQIMLYLEHNGNPHADPYADAREDGLEIDIGEFCDSDRNLSFWIGEVEDARAKLLSLGIAENSTLGSAIKVWP